MKKNPQMQKALKFLNNHKHLFGFAGYNVVVKDESDHEHDEAGAETQVFNGAQMLVITLYKGWDVEPFRDWKNLLLHELIHARISLYVMDYTENARKLEYQYQEACVCDITKGVEELLKRK
jgi:hypothetical protein